MASHVTNLVIALVLTFLFFEIWAAMIAPSESGSGKEREQYRKSINQEAVVTIN